MVEWRRWRFMVAHPTARHRCFWCSCWYWDCRSSARSIWKHDSWIASKKRMVYTQYDFIGCICRSFYKYNNTAAAMLTRRLHSAINRELYDVMTRKLTAILDSGRWALLQRAGDDQERNRQWHRKFTRKQLTLLPGFVMTPGFYADGLWYWTGKSLDRKKFNLLDKVDWEESKRYGSWLIHRLDSFRLIKNKTILWFKMSCRWANIPLSALEWMGEIQKYKMDTAWSLGYSGRINWNVEKRRAANVTLAWTYPRHNRMLLLLLQLFPPNENNEKWDVLPTFWITRRRACQKRRKEDGVPYLIGWSSGIYPILRATWWLSSSSKKQVGGYSS